MESRITEVLGTIREDTLLHFGDQVNVLWRVVRDAFEEWREEILHLEKLDHGKPAGAGRGRGQEFVTAPVGPQWFAPDSLVALEVCNGNQPAATLHLRDNQVRRLSLVKAFRAQFGDTSQRCRELGLFE